MKDKITLNETIREAISIALIHLMKTKSFSEISISEITRVAGVSRSSFYRNYDSKEQILICYIHDLYNNFFHTENILRHFPDQSGLQEFLLPRFRFIKENREFFTVLYKNNLLYYIFDEMEPDLILLLSGQNASISKYYLSMFAGSYAATIRHWIHNDFQESEEEMAAIFADYPH